MAYFFACDKIENGAFYSAYTFLNDEPPYLWSATVECVVNRNKKYRAGKNGPQLVQPPNTVTLTAVHFHCIQVKDVLQKWLAAYVGIDNSLFHITHELLEEYIKNKELLGATWIIEAIPQKYGN